MFIRALFPIGLAVVIFIATCNLDPVTILSHPYLFKFTASPNLSDLLITSDIAPADHFYQFQKIGHFTAFGLLYGFLFNWLRNYKLSFLMCGGYALLTEVLQLFFHRDGRLFDVLIDLAGITLSWFICKYILYRSGKSSIKQQM